MVSWEQAWPGAEGLNDMAQVVHRGCKAADARANDAATTVRMHCAACQLAVSPRDISFRVSQSEMAKMPAKSTATRKTSQDTAVKPGDVMTPIPQGLAVLGDKWSIEALLRRTTDDDDAHRKGLYLLTPKGRVFYAILIAIQSWADEWIHHRVRSPVKLRHAPCQKPLLPLLVCMACGQAVTHVQGRIRMRPWL